MYPVPSKDLTAKGKPLVCTETGAEFKPCAATLVRRSVNMVGPMKTLNYVYKRERSRKRQCCRMLFFSVL